MSIEFATPPWLVAIDLQNVFGDPASPWCAPRFEAASAGTRRLLSAFPARVALTRFVAPAAPTGAWIPYYRDWPFALVPADDPLYDLAPGLADAVPAPTVITRTTFGKWDADTAAALSHPLDIVLTGVSTDCCVIATALAAADAGVRVRVVEDACAGATDVDHTRALEAMALFGPLIEVTTVDKVLAAL